MPVASARRPLEPVEIEALHDPSYAAHKLHCSVWTVKRLVASGQLECVKVGKLTRLTDRHIANYIERRSLPAREVPEP